MMCKELEGAPSKARIDGGRKGRSRQRLDQRDYILEKMLWA